MQLLVLDWKFLNIFCALYLVFAFPSSGRFLSYIKAFVFLLFAFNIYFMFYLFPFYKSDILYIISMLSYDDLWKQADYN